MPLNAPRDADEEKCTDDNDEAGHVYPQNPRWDNAAYERRNRMLYPYGRTDILKLESVVKVRPDHGKKKCGDDQCQTDNQQLHEQDDYLIEQNSDGHILPELDDANPGQ